MPRLVGKLFVVLALVWAGLANANLISNGDFSTGDFTSWDLFTYNGNLGPAGANLVTYSDVTGYGASLAGRFQVGTAELGVDGGGGISQSIYLAGNDTLNLSVDISALATNGQNNDWGKFQLLLDGNIVDILDVPTQAGFNQYSETLSFSGVAAAGAHIVSILITRAYFNGGDSVTPQPGYTPYQYVDNVLALVPASATIYLLGLGLAALGFSLRLRKQHS